ncbi:cytoplasmic polyadenylation element-binding protein 1-like [Lethenteron reissneri]|uniref:cytoplasmic polyadenylation element-binding protein 1-like n=1 Tax=Lethenteron reissneri TaxID=7753 RepID=UPI002AB6C56C|nr:cytoplasmic polyadenylation element-binding protein 1-like [Lethenteron reissneri]
MPSLGCYPAGRGDVQLQPQQLQQQGREMTAATAAAMKMLVAPAHPATSCCSCRNAAVFHTINALLDNNLDLSGLCRCTPAECPAAPCEGSAPSPQPCPATACQQASADCAKKPQRRQQQQQQQREDTDEGEGNAVIAARKIDSAQRDGGDAAADGNGKEVRGASTVDVELLRFAISEFLGSGGSTQRKVAGDTGGDVDVAALVPHCKVTQLSSRQLARSGGEETEAPAATKRSSVAAVTRKSRDGPTGRVPRVMEARPVAPADAAVCHIEKEALLHKKSAVVSDAKCGWSGKLPKRSHQSPTYSCKVFMGGVPWDITEAGILNSVKNFGPLVVEWPVRDGKQQTARKEAFPKGYVYILFEQERSIRALLQACKTNYNNAFGCNMYYYEVSSRKMKSKVVQVIPWVVADSNYTSFPSPRLESHKTVFVGALHGMLNAEGLAVIMNDLFGGVVYAGIDTDKYKYPIGSGRVTFNNPTSYMNAVTAAIVEIKTTKFTKKIQIDPYLEDSICQVCSHSPGNFFCRATVCFSYYCRSCWQLRHSAEGLSSHRPLMRNQRVKTAQ